MPPGNSGFVSAKKSLVHDCNFTGNCTAEPCLLYRNDAEAMVVSASMNFNTERIAAMHIVPTQQAIVRGHCLDGSTGNRVAASGNDSLNLFSLEKHKSESSNINIPILSLSGLYCAVVPNVRSWVNRRVVVPAPTVLFRPKYLLLFRTTVIWSLESPTDSCILIRLLFLINCCCLSATQYLLSEVIYNFHSFL